MEEFLESIESYMNMGSELWYCPFCDKTFRLFCHLKEHVRRVHFLFGTCPICFRKYKRLVVHFCIQGKRDELHLMLCGLYGAYKDGADRCLYKQAVKVCEKYLYGERRIPKLHVL